MERGRIVGIPMIFNQDPVPILYNPFPRYIDAGWSQPRQKLRMELTNVLLV